MRVLLLRPPLEFGAGWDVAAQAEIPLALLYLASSLEKEGHQAAILDGAIQNELGRLAPDERGVLRVGMAWDEFGKEAAAARPDVVGISSGFYTQMPQALMAARVVRGVLPNVPIVVGGPPVTVRPEDYLAEPAVTVAVMGEGEQVLPRLAEALVAGSPLEGIQSIAYREGGKVRVNQRQDYLRELDALSDPAYHLIDIERYMRVATMGRSGRWSWKPRRAMTILTSRGCPYQCTFCAAHLHMGRAYRTQSAERVLAHVRFIVTKLGIPHLLFIDDNLAQNVPRFNAILDGLIAMKKEGLPITWETPIGMRTDKLTYDVLAKSKQAGCEAIYLTTESGSQRVLDEVVGKHLNLQSVLDAAAACKKLGLKARAGFIMGLPGEKLEDMRMTIDFARRLRREYGIRGHLAVATPIYGTELYNICERKGYRKMEMTPDNIARSFTEGGMIETEDWTIPQMLAMVDEFKLQGSWLHRTVRRMRRGLRKDKKRSL